MSNARFHLIVLAVAAAYALTACGGGEESPSETRLRQLGANAPKVLSADTSAGTSPKSFILSCPSGCTDIQVTLTATAGTPQVSWTRWVTPPVDLTPSLPLFTFTNLGSDVSGTCTEVGSGVVCTYQIKASLPSASQALQLVVRAPGSAQVISVEVTTPIGAVTLPLPAACDTFLSSCVR